MTPLADPAPGNASAAVFACKSRQGKGRLMVWLGCPFFSSAMRDVGWRLIHRPVLPGELLTWDDILSLTGGEIPEVVVVGDFSGPPFLLGVENFSCITIWYSVDSHIHAWHPAYAQAFDLCLVSLHDRLPDFCTGRLAKEQILWSPPYVRDAIRPPSPLPGKEWDLLFVGSLKPDVAPARCSFLDEVKARFPGFHVDPTGSFAALYPKARLVLNECSRGELNFRVFEALGCGACLLTPDIGAALDAFFTNDKELVLYPAYNAAALIEKARELLADEAQREAIAAAGLAAVDAGHRASHRALALASHLDELTKSGLAERLIAERRKFAREIAAFVLRPLYLHHAESIEDEALRLRFLKAARTGNT